MSRIAVQWFRALRIGMSPAEKVVGGYLAYRAEEETHLMWPSCSTMAEDAEVSIRTIHNTLARLIARGIIVRMGTREGSAVVMYRMAVDLTVIARPPVRPKKVPTPGNFRSPPGPSDRPQIMRSAAAKNAEPPAANYADNTSTIKEESTTTLTTRVRASPGVGVSGPADGGGGEEGGRDGEGYPGSAYGEHLARFAHPPAPRSRAPTLRTEIVLNAAHFAEWYALYPHKKSPNDAEVAYSQQILAGATPERMLAALRRQRKAMLEAEPRYRPYPATWLRRGSWKEEPLVERPRRVMMAGGL